MNEVIEVIELNVDSLCDCEVSTSAARQMHVFLERYGALLAAEEILKEFF